MDGKVIAITGGASASLETPGMGLALANILLSRGAIVSVADISQENLDKAEYIVSSPDRLLRTRVDVRDLKSVEAWLDNTIDKFGRLDGAANLAGIAGRDFGKIRLQDQDEDEWENIIATNLTGAMHCVKSELKRMDKGSIVNASSVAGQTYTMPLCAAYCVSKAGVANLTRCAAREEGHRGIRVNAVAPGIIHTPMTAALAQDKDTLDADSVNAAVTAVPIGRAGKAEEVATLVAFLLSDEASYITGSIQTVDGGLSL